MALGKAIVLGLAAAVAVPSVMRSEPGDLGEWVHWMTVHPLPGNHAVLFSIPLFVVVTLFAWLFIGWATRE